MIRLHLGDALLLVLPVLDATVFTSPFPLKHNAEPEFPVDDCPLFLSKNPFLLKCFVCSLWCSGLFQHISKDLLEINLFENCNKELFHSSCRKHSESSKNRLRTQAFERDFEKVAYVLCLL